MPATSTSTAATTGGRAPRYAAAAATALMSLMNLPFAFDDVSVSKPVAWLVTLLGVAGLVAVVGLLRKATWGPWAVTAIGVVNLAGGVAALLADQEGAAVGVALSLVVVTLGLACARGQRTERATRPV